MQRFSSFKKYKNLIVIRIKNALFLVFRASQMLAPLATASHQELPMLRHQQHSLKLPNKLRKSHDTDFNHNKKATHKDGNHSVPFQHVSSPAEALQDETKTNQLRK
jgi:hypothetical protein